MSGAVAPAVDVLQHRLYVGPPVAGRPLDELSAYWHHEHRKVAPGLPELLGYVQNRPLPGWLERIPYLTCAETWYASFEAEHRSYASNYYRDVVVPDEERFIDRAGSWHSPVTATRVLRDGPRSSLRVLAIGGDVERLGEPVSGDRLELLDLHRDPPVAGPKVVVSLWTDDALLADVAAAQLGGIAFVTRPVPIVDPPLPGWGG